MAQLETIKSQRWPNLSAEIHRELHSAGKTVFRVKIASQEFPALATQRIFTTKDDAVAHARIVLGF